MKKAILTLLLLAGVSLPAMAQIPTVEWYVTTGGPERTQRLSIGSSSSGVLRLNNGWSCEVGELPPYSLSFYERQTVCTKMQESFEFTVQCEKHQRHEDHTQIRFFTSGRKNPGYYIEVGCKVSNPDTYTLYGSVAGTPKEGKTHIETFDLWFGEDYNREGCQMAQKRFQSYQNQAGETFRYWCEKGPYKK